MTTNDTFFLSYEEAYNQAIKGELKELSPACKAPALCYYLTDYLSIERDNLIGVPKDRIKEFFLETSYRLPTYIMCNTNNEESLEKARFIANELNNTIQYMHEKTLAIVDKCKSTPPPSNKEPLRILGIASKITTVLQYNCKSLLEALEKNGCVTRFVIQPDLSKTLDGYISGKEILDFKPHVVLSFNVMCGEYLHPDVINLCWWQDLTTQLLAADQYKFRDKDICLYVPPLGKYLERLGSKKNYRQYSLIDNDIFYDQGIKNKDYKIVVVASNYIEDTDTNSDWNQVYNQIYDDLDNNHIHYVTMKYLDNLACTYNVHIEDIFWTIMPKVIRKITVKWLCQCADLIDVEVYGRNWENEPLVKNYFKGELPHGKAVADVYNNATYSLVAHGFTVVSQRLAEVSACGCIPIVFDSRNLSDTPHWDNECVWFHNYDSLREKIRKHSYPPCSPKEIYKDYTYDRAAKSLVNKLKTML